MFYVSEQELIEEGSYLDQCIIRRCRLRMLGRIELRLVSRIGISSECLVLKFLILYLFQEQWCQQNILWLPA